MKKEPNSNLRYNLLSGMVYLMGTILLVQLFTLQIVNGATYRETSNTRLTRESTLYAARGSILDRNGSTLAGVNMTFALEIYKTKSENSVLNATILKTLKTLEENGDTYTDTFPITIEPFAYNFSSEEKKNTWLEKYNLDSNTSAEEAFYYFKDKYEITEEDPQDIRKIIIVRYRISSEGYSSTKSLTISDNISRKSALIFEEQGDEYLGIDVVTNWERYYPNGSVASHILGYINSISDKQYEENKNEGYTISDVYGQAGVEYVFENYLKGENGTRQIDMSVDGNAVSEYTETEAIAGANVVLTIDANLQAIAERSLKETIETATGTAKDASAGAIVVMNAKTGEILAMASYPDYDPNSWVGGIDNDTWNYYMADESNKPLINRAISSAYAPGSTFKMVVATAGLQTGNITVNEKINDIGVYPISGDHKPKCWIYDSTRTWAWVFECNKCHKAIMQLFLL